MKHALIIDVETTGLKPKDEIIELGAVLFEYDKKKGQVGYIVETYSGLREPGVSISKAAQEIHGISSKMIRGQALDTQRIEELIDKADIIIAHNVRFDQRFVSALIPSARRKGWRCSMDDINWAKRGHASKGLQELATDYGIAQDDGHRALSDCKTVYKLLSIENHFKELLGADRQVFKLSFSGEEKYPALVEGESNYTRNILKIIGYYDEYEGYEDDNHEAFLTINENSADPAYAVEVRIDGLTVGNLKGTHAKTYLKRLESLGAPRNAVTFCTASIHGGKQTGGYRTSFGVRLDFEPDAFLLYESDRTLPKWEPGANAITDPKIQPGVVAPKREEQPFFQKQAEPVKAMPLPQIPAGIKTIPNPVAPKKDNPPIPFIVILIAAAIIYMVIIWLVGGK
jgi:DNA polymerase III epsilon subunit-like protein